jgi:uncharacterized protein
VKIPSSLEALIAEDDRAIERANGERPKKVHVRRFAGVSRYSDQLEHLRVAHLTDLHVGRVTPRQVQEEAVRRTNAAKPDLVVMTGDFVCHSQAYLADLEEIVRGFQSPVIATLGNHDHWSGANEVRRALKRAGAICLDNQWTTVTLRGQKLQVVGLDDAYTGNADRERATKGISREVATLGLSHIGEEADGLWARGVPFVLSGHTHAGQVTLARLHEIMLGKLAGHKYVHGLYGDRRGEGALYVGAGIGASVMPVRVGDRGKREVALFELGHTPGSWVEHHAEQPAHRGRKPSAKQMLKRASKVTQNELKRKLSTR